MSMSIEHYSVTVLNVAPRFMSDKKLTGQNYAYRTGDEKNRVDFYLF